MQIGPVARTLVDPHLVFLYFSGQIVSRGLLKSNLVQARKLNTGHWRYPLLQLFGFHLSFVIWIKPHGDTRTRGGPFVLKGQILQHTNGWIFIFMKSQPVENDLCYGPRQSIKKGFLIIKGASEASRASVRAK